LFEIAASWRVDPAYSTVLYEAFTEVVMPTKSKVNAAGNYTKPEMRKKLFNEIKSQAVQGTKAGQWSARKAQLLAKKYKEKGGGYRD
jgi:uncharacterized protein with WD repeat